MELETRALAALGRCGTAGDRTVAAVAGLALLEEAAEHCGMFEPTLLTLRDVFERLIFSDMPHPDVPVDQRVPYFELNRRDERDGELEARFVRRAEVAEAEVTVLRKQVRTLQGYSGGLTAKQREQNERAQQKAVEDIVGVNRLVVIEAQEATDTMTTRAGELRERLDEANQRAREAYAEMGRRIEEHAAADAAAIRRADEPTPQLTAEGIAGRLRAELAALGEVRAEATNEWGLSRDPVERRRAAFASEIAREIDLVLKQAG